MSSPPSAGSIHGVSPKVSGTSVGSSQPSDVDLNQIMEVRLEERAISEMERLRLERQVLNLQQANEELEEILEEHAGAGM